MPIFSFTTASNIHQESALALPVAAELGRNLLVIYSWAILTSSSMALDSLQRINIYSMSLRGHLSPTGRQAIH